MATLASRDVAGITEDQPGPCWGVAIGLVTFIAGISHYRSYANRVILGIWSPGFAAGLLLLSAIALVVVVRGVRRALIRAPAYGGIRSNIWQAGAAATGLGYLLGSSNSAEAGRAMSGVIWGSAQPLSALVSLIALGCFSSMLMLTLFQRRNGRFGSFLALPLVLVPLVWVGEAAARVRAISFPVTQLTPTYASDAWRARYVRQNAAGFRDAEHAPGHDAETRRVALIGDSFAFGWGIRDTADRFGERLVQQLNRDCRSAWEGLNFSAPDTHTLEHFAFLGAALRAHPDLVILEYVFNDIDYLKPSGRPDGSVDDSGLVRLAPFRLLFGNSFLFQELFERWLLFEYRWGLRNAPPALYLESDLLDRHLTDLRHLATLAEEQGVRFVVVPVDPRIMADTASRSIYLHVVDRMRSEGLSVISTDSAFDGASWSELRVNAMDGHPSPHANALLAAFVAPRLRSLGALSACPASELR